MRKIFFTFMTYWLINLAVFAGSFNREYLEKDYQNAWCSLHSGEMEIVLPDKARVDCVTKTHAIEFDFADKWGESIGQSLYYATILDKKAGIVLIMENPQRDEKYLKRVQAVADAHKITLWTITPDELLRYFGRLAKK